MNTATSLNRKEDYNTSCLKYLYYMIILSIGFLLNGLVYIVGHLNISKNVLFCYLPLYSITQNVLLLFLSTIGTSCAFSSRKNNNVIQKNSKHPLKVYKYYIVNCAFNFSTHKINIESCFLKLNSKIFFKHMYYVYTRGKQF